MPSYYSTVYVLTIFLQMFAPRVRAEPRKCLEQSSQGHEISGTGYNGGVQSPSKRSEKVALLVSVSVFDVALDVLLHITHIFVLTCTECQ